MKVAYIAGPYRAPTKADIENNIQRARRYAIKYWQRGYATICPHLNTAHFDNAGPPELWLRGDLEILKRCDVIVMMPGWKNSEGAQAEHNLARQKGLEVIYEGQD